MGHGPTKVSAPAPAVSLGPATGRASDSPALVFCLVVMWCVLFWIIIIHQSSQIITKYVASFWNQAGRVFTVVVLHLPAFIPSEIWTSSKSTLLWNTKSPPRASSVAQLEKKDWAKMVKTRFQWVDMTWSVGEMSGKCALPTSGYIWDMENLQPHLYRSKLVLGENPRHGSSLAFCGGSLWYPVKCRSKIKYHEKII